MGARRSTGDRPSYWQMRIEAQWQDSHMIRKKRPKHKQRTPEQYKAKREAESTKRVIATNSVDVQKVLRIVYIVSFNASNWAAPAGKSCEWDC